MRAVIAWDATPSYWDYDRRPGVDLYLVVYNSSGGLVRFSSSWDNTYEIVEFAAAQTGNYTLKIRKWRFDDSYTYLGVAWNAYWG